MEYERLTKRLPNGEAKSLDWDGEILHRLAELEDMIESGQAVILPYKVGEEVWYFANPLWREPEKAKITGYRIEIPSNKARVYLHNKNDSFEYEDDTRLEWTASTKEAAEAKLKELRGEL